MDFAAEAARLEENTEQTPPEPDNETTPAARPCEPSPEDVKDYIVEETNLTAAEVEEAAHHYRDQFHYSGLSIYYLVGQDHGVNPAQVFETVQRDFSLDITNLPPELNTVDLTAEIARITPINDFEREDGSKGKVCNVILKDDTGRCVLTLWDDTTQCIDELETGDTVRIEDGYSKVASDYCQSRLGCDVEVRLGDEGTLLRNSGDEWAAISEA